MHSIIELQHITDLKVCKNVVVVAKQSFFGGKINVSQMYTKIRLKTNLKMFQAYHVGSLIE